MPDSDTLAGRIGYNFRDSGGRLRYKKPGLAGILVPMPLLELHNQFQSMVGTVAMEFVQTPLHLLAQQIPGDEFNWDMVWVAGGLVLLFICLIFFAIFASYFRWWIQSILTGAGVGLFDLVGMTFRKVRPSVIVPSKIMAVQAGLVDEDLTTKALEAHYMAGGNVPMVVRSLIAANKAKNNSAQLS